MMILGAFDVKSTLPTHENNATWHLPITSQTTLTLAYDNPIFKTPKASIGMYTIAVHSHTAASYFISLFTIKRSIAGEELQARKVYLGETSDITIEKEDSRYFYYENWSNSTIKIQFMPEQNTPSRI